MTDGILFRETLVDPMLSRYSVIMVGTIPIWSNLANDMPIRLMRLTNEVFTPTFYWEY